MNSPSRERTSPSGAATGAAGIAEAETELEEGRPRQVPQSHREPGQDEALGENRQTLITLFRQMVLIRRFEEKCAESYALGKIGGFCHLYIGQEAVGVGAISALRPDDYLITSYREHGQAIVKGIPPAAVMAELFGKSGGCSRGKGGSMHLFNSEVNFLGGHAIVGAQIPLATGVAFAAKYRQVDQVTLCFFGEAAVNQGAFHESLNLAQLWKLPCVYICENNKYGMGTSLERAMSLQNIAEKACAYQVAAETVDGMDVLAMRQATQRAVARARQESLPTLLEARTYRFMGHSMSDPGKYRTRAEIEEYQLRDPITLFSARLKEQDLLDEQEIAEIEAQVREEIEKAVRLADESPEPDASELYTNVYAGRQ